MFLRSCSASLILLTSCLSVGADDALIKTDAGLVLGVAHPSLPYRMWRGVPYAEPPLRNLRWMPPVAKKPWSGVLETIDYSPGCPQDITATGNIDGLHNNGFFASSMANYIDEDCLYLNIFAPNKAKLSAGQDSFPIIVYVYGSGYDAGSADDRELDPRLQVGNGQAIYVTFNYRTSVLGYGFSAAMQARTPDGSAGNFGTQDQRLMLQWLQKNAAAFGGNPHQILFTGHDGHPAKHLITPRSWGLLRAVGFNSGAFQNWMARPKENAEKQFAAFLHALGCPSDAKAGLQCALNASAESVIAASESTELPFQGNLYSAVWEPVVDGVELLDYPMKLLEAGKVAPNVSVIMGVNKDEGTMFATVGSTSVPFDMNATGFQEWAVKKFGHANAAKIAKLYEAPTRYPSWYWSAVAAIGDFFQKCQSRRVARAVIDPLRHGGAAMPLWYYNFQHVPLNKTNDDRYRRGACHSCEIDFIMQTKWLASGEETELARNIGAYFAGIASSGDPNNLPKAARKLPSWPQFTRISDEKYLQFDVASAGGLSVHQDLQKAECDFWDTVPYPEPDCILDPLYLCVNATSAEVATEISRPLVYA